MKPFTTGTFGSYHIVNVQYTISIGFVFYPLENSVHKIMSFYSRRAGYVVTCSLPAC